MLRSLKIGSVLAASTAALALGIAAPANADGVSVQALTGTAYTLPGATAGPSERLESTNTGCTALSAGRRSGRVDSGMTSYHFYSDTGCNTLVGTATPGNPDLLFDDVAIRYAAF